MTRHNDLGKWGEQLAVDILAADGWSILERNWRMGHLELDIVAQKNEKIVFAEVKTRAEMDIDPLEAVDKRKITNMVRSAEAYMARTGLDFEARFDLFAINGTPDGEYTVDHIPDAFDPPLKTIH